ncbi:MAG: dipeptidase [Candidatus Glassbacteria bacterium]|nr:dipeptidase [Candidatus Glassbacteria bacterium]
MIIRRLKALAAVALCCWLPAGISCQAPGRQESAVKNPPSPEAARPPYEEFLAGARELNRRILNLDTHVDIPWDFATEELDPGVRQEKLQVDLVKMAEGDLDAVFFIGWARQGPLTAEGYSRARDQVAHSFEAIHRLCEQMYPGRIELAVSPAEVERITGAGKLAAVIGLENGYPLGTDLSMVETYYGLGVRYITLCHVGHNQICDSANPPFGEQPDDAGLDEAGKQLLSWVYGVDFYSDASPEPLHGGLSGFGRQVVAEMNRLGIMVDVSHLAAGSVLDVVEASSAPVIASHSCCRALCNITRNLDDRCLRAIKESGGCIQVTAVPGFVKLPVEQLEAVSALLDSLGATEMDFPSLFAMYNENRPAYDSLVQRSSEGFKRIEMQSVRPDVSDLVDHLDYLVEVVGIDHVGIGSDFGGGGGVRGFNSAAEAVNVTAELLRRGYTEEDIARIWGGNLLRVWREVGQAAEVKDL